MNEWTPPTTPGGGGFSTAKYSLDYLYEQYILGNNIWTSSNCPYDLCRYTGCKFIFYRHMYIDFIVQYDLEYPLSISPSTLQEMHPKQLLLQKHTIVIPSLKSHPFGKRYVKKKILPPKQMTNKWFFQHQFTSTGLVLMKAVACDLQFSHMGEQSENELVSFLCLNTDNFYMQGGWGTNQPHNYFPISTWGPTTTIEFVTKSGQTKHYTLSTYNETISYDKGWFSSDFMTAKEYKKPDTNIITYKPVRYNPKIDTGQGNAVYFVSVNNHSFDPPRSDKILITQNKPLWQLLYGWTDYIQALRKNNNFYKEYFIVLISPALRVSARQPADKPIIPIDDSFINGKSAYNYFPDTWQKTNWYPTFAHQQQAINNIVKTGAFIPKLEGKRANWELHAKYSFFFKWGGSLNPNKQVCDPSKASEYPGPDPVTTTVQISDPISQVPFSILHSWDWRRGFLKKSALKRMYQNLPAEQTISTDADHQEPPQKIRKSKREPSLQEKETKEQITLQELFEENTYPEIPQETQDPIQQLILQQQHQQHLLKLNLLKLITSMKDTQLQMQLQTGML